jgi:hypothetical protein
LAKNKTYLILGLMCLTFNKNYKKGVARHPFVMPKLTAYE